MSRQKDGTPGAISILGLGHGLAGNKDVALDLPALLRALWVRKVLNKKKLKELIRQIETEQGMVIKNKEEIFK